MVRIRRFPKGIFNTNPPKMKNARGRTWDTLTVILPDGIKVPGYFDSTWGNNFYFMFEGKWYRGGWEFDTNKDKWVPTPDLRYNQNIS